MDNIEVEAEAEAEVEVRPELENSFNKANAAAVHAVNALAGKLVNEKKFRAAKIALCRALTAAPTDHSLYSNLSSVLWSLRSYEDSRLCAQTSLDLNPNPDDIVQTAAARVALGNACVSLGDYKQAMYEFTRVITEHPDKESEHCLDARWNRSLLHLLLGDYVRGFEDYFIRIDRFKKEHEKDSRYSSPLWRGESLEGKNILLLHDQGYGDTIMYSRFLPFVASQARKVYMSVSPNLVPLFYDLAEVCGIQFLHYGAPLPDVHYHAYLGCIPKQYLDLSSPTLFPPAIPSMIRERVEKDRYDSGVCITVPEPKTNPALKIGICWSGRPDFGRNDERMVPFRLMMSLAENPYFWLYSFQMGSQSQEISEKGADPFIMNLDPYMREKGWVGTATAMLQMDVIVTCCTSIAHLAGTLGIPCWVMLGTEPYWVWGHEGESTPWYPSARLFRQRRDRRGDWTCVLEEVRSELQKLLITKAQGDVQGP